MEKKHIVEAVLFAAGRPVSARELGQNLDLPTRDVTRIMKEITADYEGRGGPITIVKTIKDEYVMQLTAEYSEVAETYIPRARESRALLKTLALIAYKQPIEQSRVITFRGTSAYKHLKELEERRLIARKPKERTYIITTTKEFCELYGLTSTDPQQVKTKFEQLLGGTQPDDSSSTAQ